MSCPRIGHINFLNVLPLTYSFAHGGSRGLYLTHGVPAVLNSDIVNERLDLSPISSIIYARQSENLLLLPDICIRSDGSVQSILLVSRKPIDDLKDDKIILTAKSATSHCLLKIILRSAYGAIPNYYIRNLEPEHPIPDDAAASLFIGDDALYLYHHPPKGCYCYDLGKEWKTLTGKSMIYAVWAVRSQFAAENPELLQLAYDRIIHGMKKGLQQKPEAIRSVLAEKPFTYEELDEYLGSIIHWDFTAEHLDGLKTFYDLAHKMNLIDHLPEIRLADIHRA